MWGKAMKKPFISRGCRIEHDAAVAYGIPIVEV